MKPVALPYPDALNTLGDHIRKRRLDLGIRQKDVAQQFGVTTDSVTNWELNRSDPRLHLIPRINGFLGYVPFPDAHEDESFGKQIVRVRRALGIRQDKLARRLGVDLTTLARWERDESEPAPVYERRITEFLGSVFVTDMTCSVTTNGTDERRLLYNGVTQEGGSR